MINKTYKIIHNKYLSFFKFIFFLRYLFLIFLSCTVLYLCIPFFFDYSKNEDVLKSYLLQHYKIDLKKLEKVKYNILPVPNIEISNAVINLKKENLNINSKALIIYPNLSNLYNYDNFKSKKIKIIHNKIILKTEKLYDFINYLSDLNSKINISNSLIQINGKDVPLTTLHKVNYKNYGHNKNLISGEIFDRKFEIKFLNNFKSVKFKLFETGIFAELNFKEKASGELKTGEIKAKILNSKLKFDFIYHENKIKILNSFYRGKKISLDGKSEIVLKPFFNFKSNYLIKEINIDNTDKLKFLEFIKNKDMIKKIISSNTFIFKSKKFSKSFLDEYQINLNFSYGRLTYSKKILISDSIFKCSGYSNLLDEYPILYFDCELNSKSKKKLLKKFEINFKKVENLDLKFKGNLNILNNKINFDQVKANNNYSASEEDLKFFKNNFENNNFDEGITKIFNKKKIKNFLMELL